MTFTIDTKNRTAILGGTSSFAAGENIDIVLSGIRSPDLATLVLDLWSDQNVNLAKGTGFTALSETSVDVWVGTLTTKTAPINTLFAGKVPGHIERCQLVIGDVNHNYVFQPTTLDNNPQSVPGEYPVPETFVTLVMLDAAIATHDADLTAHPTLVRNADFSNVPQIGDDYKEDDLRDTLNRVMLILKGQV